MNIISAYKAAVCKEFRFVFILDEFALKAEYL